PPDLHCAARIHRQLKPRIDRGYPLSIAAPIRPNLFVGGSASRSSAAARLAPASVTPTEKPQTLWNNETLRYPLPCGIFTSSGLPKETRGATPPEAGRWRTDTRKEMQHIGDRTEAPFHVFAESYVPTLGSCELIGGGTNGFHAKTRSTQRPQRKDRTSTLRFFA